MFDQKSIQLVVFDCFGTLLQIQTRLNPYKKLLKHLESFGRVSQKDDAKIIMSSNVALEAVPALFGYELPSEIIDSVRSDLLKELDSVGFFEDAAILLDNMLKSDRYELAICSNLATPYVPIASDLLSLVPNQFWSCELGLTKPQPEIYEAVLSQCKCPAKSALMIGDSRRNDVDGPKKFGMQALHLDRLSNAAGSICSLASLHL